MSTTSKNKILNKENLGFNCLYSNVDQLLNKMKDLQMLIASSKPDLMLFTEVIPKSQVNPILDAQLKIKGYELYTNFDNLESNLGASGIRGTAIYVQENIKSKEVSLQSQFDDHLWVEIGLQKAMTVYYADVFTEARQRKNSLQ